VADARVDVVGVGDLPLIADLYSRVFRPGRDAEFFRRRFLGRYNTLLLVASLEEHPVGFATGFELKPGVFFAWLYGVVPECRRMGIATQLMAAMHAWAAEHGYATMRFECHNQHRPMLHLAIAQEYDIVGIRWDADRSSNLVIFEKLLATEEEA